MRMKQKLFSILALLLMAVTGAMAEESESFTTNQVLNTYTGTHFTISCPYAGDEYGLYLNSSGATITARNGEKITRVVLTVGFFVDWAGFTTSTAGTVNATNGNSTITINDVNTTTLTISNSEELQIKAVTVYYGATDPAPTTYAVTLAEGTEDAENWTITPAKAAEGETVTIQYNGTRRIKSITAVQTAAAEEQQEQAVTTATPLTMECLTDGTIKVDMSSGYGTLSTGMQYAVNGGEKTKITETTEISGLKTGDKVQFYGVGTETQVYGGDVEVSISGGTAQVKVYGNIMSLLDETGFATKTDLPSSDYVTN